VAMKAVKQAKEELQPGEERAPTNFETLIQRAEAETVASKTKLEAALASMGDAVFISDIEGRFVEFNDAFATFHKFRNKEECATTFAEYPEFLEVFMPNGELAPVEQWAVPRALRGETATNAEYTLRRKDTGEMWVGSYSFAPIRDLDGVITGSVVAGRDITERKRAEQELRRHRDHLEQLVKERTAELELRNSELETEIRERKRVMELLLQSEQRYRAVVEDQTETINRVSCEGNYTFVNDVFCRFFGKTRGELLGCNWQPDAHPDDRTKIEELLATLSPANPVVTIENRVFDGSGDIRWMQFVNRGFFDDHGRLIESQAVGRDITEQKVIKQALRASEEQYRLLFEQMICGIMLVEVIFDAAGAPCDYRLVQANPAFETLTGVSAQGEIGKTSKDMSIGWPPEIVQEFYRVAVTGEPIQYERFNETLGRHYETRVFSPRRGQFAIVFTDITERKRFEQEVSEYTEEVQDLYDHAPCGYHSLDADGLFLRINDTELKMLGYEAHELIGKKGFFDLVEPERRWAFYENFAKFKELGYANGIQYVLLRKDGSKLPVLLSATAIRDACGNFALSCGSLLDITDHYRAEEALKRYAHRLIVLEETLRQKIAVELHDNIAQVLVAAAFNLKSISESLPQKLGSKLKPLFEKSQKLNGEVIGTLRNLMTELRPSLLDDLGLAEAIRCETDKCANWFGIGVDVQIDQEFYRPPVEQGVLVFRIIQEALNNIVKHAAATKVSVFLGSRDGSLQLCINDNGKGFGPHATPPLPTEAGWGLALMCERAKLLGGRFRIDSVLGEGTTITVEMGERF
jgi:PAS domain S-box-containing protein